MVQEDVRRPYVDFTYYKNDYGGTQIKTENDFKRVENISEAFVNQVTFGRIARLSSIVDSIKDAICCVADTVAVQNEKREAVVKSESNDGYSISYQTEQTEEEFESRLYQIASTYLMSSGLLYMGVDEE